MTVLFSNLTVTVRGRSLLRSISTEVRRASVTGLLGPNGAGKSTLLKALAGVLTPTSGSLFLAGQDLSELHRRESAQRIALLEQSAEPATDMTVIEVVLLGRIPHRTGLLGRFDRMDDRQVAMDALRRVEIVDLAERRWSTLSGGLQQRVRIARAIAQEPQLLLLDEPTNHLDIRSQQSFLGGLGSLNTTCIVALHDLNLASAFCDFLILIAEGRIVATGTPTEVLRPETIEEAYGLKCDVIKHPRHHGPLVVF
ncbi:ABC transporter ATP-binding protein [Leifsonia sp. NPDC056824]|uniref:ABC transporter ATP-binding protein n=1 Tax=Leifsonia sp. NPDC056824 TaxID=3345953 RepID=UPI0036A13C80